MNCATRFHHRIAGQAGSLDPNGAADWLIAHGLLSLVDHPRLSSPVRDRLRQECRRNLAANLRLIREFQQLHQVAGDLPLCPLKGIHLLDQAYGAAPERRYLRDIDILVPANLEGDLLDRLELGLGTTSADGTGPRPTHDRRLVGRRGALIDIHTRLAFHHGARSTWEELTPQPGRVHDCDVHLLDAETTLVHLVTHLVRHGPFARLGWVEDIVRWIDRGVDPDGTAEVAVRLGARRSFGAGIEWLQQWAGLEWPPGGNRLDGRGDAGVRLHRQLFWTAPRRPRPPRPARRLERNLSPLLLTDSPSDGMRFVRTKAREVWQRNRRRWS